MNLPSEPRRRRGLAAFLLGGLLAVAPIAGAQLPLPLPEPALDLRAATQATLIVPTPDGGAIIAHNGRWAGGDTEVPFLLRLRKDGSIDPAWTPRPNSQVNAIEIVGDDVYLAGFFSAVGGTARRGLARISMATGALSPWNPNLGAATSYRFDALALVGDALYAGGAFTQIGTVARSNLARIDRNTGALDPAFAPTVAGGNGTIVSTLRSDGAALFVGGEFTSVNGTARSRAAKLSLSDGAVDAAWAPSFNGPVTKFALDGADLFAVGCFNQINGGTRPFVARVAKDGIGAVVPWLPQPNGGCIYGLDVDATHVYIGGPFSQINGQSAQRVGRIGKTGTGTYDGGWRPTPDGVFNFGAWRRPDGNVLMVGDFIAVGGSYSPGIALVDGSTGTVLAGPGYSEQRGYVRALVDAPDGGTYVGGAFTRVGGLQRRSLLRLTPAGTIDPAWAPALVSRGEVRALGRDDGNLYVGGAFTAATPQPLSNLARIAHNGNLDTNWDPAPNDAVNALVMAGSSAAGGSVYVGGRFTTIAGQNRQRIAEVSKLAGAASPLFNPGVDNEVLALAAQGDEVFAGGLFAQANGTPRNFLAKFNATGGLLPFNPAPNERVWALLLGPSGTVYAGGGFTSIAGAARTGLARLDRTSGAQDPAWNANLNGSVLALAPAADGFYVGGTFTSAGGQPRQRVARLDPAGAVAPLFAPTIDNVVYAVQEQAGRAVVGGFVNYTAATGQRQAGVAAFPRDATPVATSLAITSDLPEGTQPFQFYRVEVNASAAGIPLSGQRILVTCDSGAFCEAPLDAAGNGACELASRTPGTRTLTARFAGTPLFLPASDTEPHTVSGTAATPPANPAFDLRSPAGISTAVRRSDGSLVVGGTFNRIGETARRGMARLLADGSVDPAYSADVIGSVGALARNAADDVFVVGGFASIDGVVKRSAAKLDPAGNVVPGWTSARSDLATSLAFVDGNGDLVVQTLATFGGTPFAARSTLLKLSGTTGAQVPGFAVEVSRSAATPLVRLATDGAHLYVYGQFDAVAGVARLNLARLNLDGSLDLAWNPLPNSTVSDVEPDGAGGVYVAGFFTEIGGQPGLGRLVRLDPAGTPASGFAAAPNGAVNGLLRDGGALIASGSFNVIGGLGRAGLARLDAATGAADPGFAQIDATLAVGLPERLGTTLWTATTGFQVSATQVTSMGAARFDLASGAQLPTATITRPALVYALARQPDGATLVGGRFARMTGGQRNLVRITPAGLFDAGFAPPMPTTGSVRSLLVRANGDIYAGELAGLRRITATGDIDPAFASPSGSVLALADAGDGVVAGGTFTAVGSPAVARNRIAKLDYATGTAVAGWNPDADGSIEALAIDASGNVYLGGGFTTIGGVGRQRLARLTPAGGLDPAWQPQADSVVRALLLDGGSVYAGGFFGQVNGTIRRGVAKIGAADGTLANWAPGGTTAFPAVFALARTLDGGILVGGLFRSMAGAFRSNAAKVDPLSGLADPLWNPSTDGPVFALLSGYGNTPTRAPLGSVLQNIALGGEFEFQGAAAMPGFVAVPSVGQPTTDGVFCDGFETSACAPAP